MCPVKGQMRSRGWAKTKFSSLCIQYSHTVPQKIENGDLFQHKINAQITFI